ncbi:MAG: hypothetical protein PHE27_01700 [Alphaproteobacteria bacterium]|nr:hypothetical protein [Alphaproteobacteria bacterium]
MDSEQTQPGRDLAPIKKDSPAAADTDQSEPNAKIDERLEKVYAEAIDTCRPHTTKDLIEWTLMRKTFPYRPNKKDDYQKAYNLTILCFALERRSDKAQDLTEETAATLEQMTRKARESVRNAFDFHQERVFRKGAERNISFFIHFSEDYGLFDHMILAHAYPEYYGAKAAPKPYLAGVDLMVDFWGWLLSGKKDDLIFSRWSKGKDKDSFSAEFFQACFAEKVREHHTDETIQTFKKALKDHVVHAGLKNISMDYHPDSSLKEAGAACDIYIGMTSFPVDTRTVYVPDCIHALPSQDKSPVVRTAYEDYFVPCVKIYNGRSADPCTIPIDKNSLDAIPQRPAALAGTGADENNPG